VAAGAILRVAKLKGDGKIRVAAAHNLRAIRAELGAGSHIDARRTALNTHLAGPASPEAVAKLADDKLAAAGVGTLRKVRKDAVRALEFVVSLPLDAVADDAAFFDAAMRWLAERFGGVANILSADVHRDEAAPHIHLLLVPLIDGRLAGSDAIGGPGKLRAMQEEFFRDVCAPHGLKRYPQQLQGKQKTNAASAILKELSRREDSAMRSVLWPLIRDHIAAAPAMFAELLGIVINSTAKPRRQRTMADIFTSPGKGPKREPEARNHIGFASRPAAVQEVEPYAL